VHDSDQSRALREGACSHQHPVKRLLSSGAARAHSRPYRSPRRLATVARADSRALQLRYPQMRPLRHRGTQSSVMGCLSQVPRDAPPRYLSSGIPRCCGTSPAVLWDAGSYTRAVYTRGLIHAGALGIHYVYTVSLRLYCITTSILYHYAYCITTPTVSLRLYCITTSTIRIHEGRIHLGPIPYHYVYSAEYTAPAALYSIQRRVYRACCTARACTRPSLHRYIETPLRHVLQYQAPALRPPS
jgi:hypothetical protein